MKKRRKGGKMPVNKNFFVGRKCFFEYLKRFAEFGKIIETKKK